MIDLIEKIERATEPSRLLDAAIEVELRRWQAYEVGLNDEQRAHWNTVGKSGEVICTQGLTRYHSPLYTFEIDAALLLVPQDWEWMVSNRAPKPHAGRAYLNNRQLHFVGAGSRPNPKYAGDEVTAITPALALCAASLRVRALTVAPHDGGTP